VASRAPSSPQGEARRGDVAVVPLRGGAARKRTSAASSPSGSGGEPGALGNAMRAQGDLRGSSSSKTRPSKADPGHKARRAGVEETYPAASPQGQARDHPMPTPRDCPEKKADRVGGARADAPGRGDAADSVRTFGGQAGHSVRRVPYELLSLPRGRMQCYHRCGGRRDGWRWFVFFPPAVNYPGTWQARSCSTRGRLPRERPRPR
jgi:hypothetical protein